MIPKTSGGSPRKRRGRSGTATKGSSHSPLKIAVPLFLLVVISGVVFLLAFDGDTEVNVPADSDQTDSNGLSIDESQTDATTSETNESTEVRGEETGVQSDELPELNESQLEAMILEAVNERRLEQGLEEVRISEELSEVARKHSRNMSEAGYVGHVDPSGTDVVRYREDCKGLSDLGNLSYSENIARSWHGEDVVPPDGGEPSFVESEQGVVENIVVGWMESDWHRNNMLDDEWRTSGVGVFSNETGAVFATQAFCSRG